jgi:hypothetical protein
LRVRMIYSFFVLGLAFGGCGRSDPGGAALARVEGWERTSPVVRHTASDLHKYLDGGAAKYLAYSIQELLVQEYRRGTDGFMATVELYSMDSPADAFGVYSCDRVGSHPKGIGLEASYEGGLLQFWQGDYYVRVQAQDPSGDPSAQLMELGAAVSGALPQSTDTPPELALSLPERGLVDNSLCFFHNQITLNSVYYVSDENLLQLSDKTDAVTAEYRTPSEAIARVIVVCYPSPETAESALAAFKSAFAEGRPGDSEGDQGFSASAEERVLAVALEASNDHEARALVKALLASAKCSRGPDMEEGQ